jgi:ketosteroid isomerase-like protein
VDFAQHCRPVARLNVASSSHLGGVPLTRSYASVLALKDGRAISVTAYVDHAEALEAVGLRE